MRDFEDEPWDANDPQLIENEDHFSNPNENPMGVEGGQDEDISRLFEDARDKLEKVEANAIKQKRHSPVFYINTIYNRYNLIKK